MRSIRKMIKRIDARLADMEREQRAQPDWLTRLMLEPGAEDEETTPALEAAPRAHEESVAVRQ